MKRYWDENTQYEVRRKIELGHYTASGDASMTTYAIKIFRDAKSLLPPLSETELVKKLSRHFNEKIRTAILGRRIETLQETLELLERFDNSGLLNSKRGENSENKTKKLRNRKNDQEKSAPAKREENWRSKGKNATTRAIRNLTSQEEKEDEQETIEECTPPDAEN